MENRAEHPQQEFPGLPPEILRLLMDHENSLLPFYVCGVVLSVCFAVTFFSKTLWTVYTYFNKGCLGNRALKAIV